MTRTRWMIALVVVLLAAAGAWLVKGRGGKETTRYRTGALERGDLTATVSATGTVKPVVQVEVGSQVSGTLEKLGADYNSNVRAGQVLCRLEPSSFEARLAQAEAAVARAEASLKDGNRQLTRARELVKSDYISQADVEAAEVLVEQRKADLKQAQASLRSAQVDLDHTVIRAPIDGVVISRSIDVGQTVAASLQAPKLFVIANDLKQMQVETRIDEADIGRVHVGLPVEFSVDAFPDVTFRGTVSQVRLEPVTDQNVVTYTTVIQTRNDDLQLRPGMTANVTVQVESRTGVLEVPNAALRFRPSGGPGGPGAGGAGMRGGAAAATPPSGAMGSGAVAHRGGPRHAGPGGAGAAGAVEPGFKPGTVYVLREGKPFAIHVLTGISDGSMTEIRTSELKPGDLVVTGTEVPRSAAGNLTPPPGMGGPQFRGPGGGGGRR